MTNFSILFGSSFENDENKNDGSENDENISEVIKLKHEVKEELFFIVLYICSYYNLI